MSARLRTARCDPGADERGSAILVVLAVLWVAAILGAAQMSDALVETRITANDLSYRLALTVAQSAVSLSLDGLRQAAASHPAWSWNPILAGADGFLGTCSTSEDLRLDPVPALQATQLPLGMLQNGCGDDGALVDGNSNQAIVEMAGVVLWRNAAGLTLFAPGSRDLQEQGLRRLAQAWAKISDTVEPDGDFGADTDGIVILRVIAAAGDLPSDARAAGLPARKNAAATLEAWLKREDDGSIRVLSLREVLP